MGIDAPYGTSPSPAFWISHPMLRTSIVRWLSIIIAAVLPPIAEFTPVAAQSVQKSTAECIRVDGASNGLGSWDEQEKNRKAWIENCEHALAADAQNDKLKGILARAYASGGRRAEAIALRRELAAKGDAASAYDIYDTFKSYGRDSIDGEKLISRAEAEASLRRAAELGDAYATWILAVLLDRGSTVKRDNDQAIAWAERAMAKPPQDTPRADIEVRLGHFLAKSVNTQNLARGITILERYSAGRGRGDAKAYLARAIRAQDPVRARVLLEGGLRDSPGHTIPLLSEMLIKGEGGPMDVKRALSLLQGGRAPDVGAVRGTLGRLMLDGKLVPKNLQEGANFLRQEAVWDIDVLIELIKLLAANPSITMARPANLLYDIYEAAELGEPGALAALLDVLMSNNAQFADKARGCALISKFAAEGRVTALERRSACA